MQRREPIKETAVVLCGGKGRRLSGLGGRLPKALAPVRGKPILWYILMRLHQDGFRHFVLPLGHLGDAIRDFCQGELANFDARLELIDTGEDTPVGRRLSLVRRAIGSDDFLLVNGDTLFDFDIADLMATHKSAGAELTLTSCRVISHYGLLFVDEAGRVVDFGRGAAVSKFIADGRDHLAGFVNAGIAVLARHTLDVAGLDGAPDFEQFLYPLIIARGGARYYAINGFWYAIETQKDLECVNSFSDRDPLARGTRLLAERLSAYARVPQVVR